MKHALNESALRQVVAEQQEEIVLFQKLLLVERDQSAPLLEVLEKPWIKVVIGIRRCGKSVLCHQVLRDKTYGYFNFDDERLVGLTGADLNQMLQFLLEIKPDVKWLFFDEIQNVDGWELFANRLQRQGYQILITGSNSKLLSKELATHLTGRHVSIELSPFSFREFLRAKKEPLTVESFRDTKARALLYVRLEEYLKTGGFPEMVVSGYNGLYLRELYDKIISRDITARYHVKYCQILKEIALYSHANLGNRLTFHKIRNIFDIQSVHTVKNYLQYLSDAYLVFLLNAFSYKFKEQIKQPRKIYTIDNGLSASISPKFTEDRGAALENLVFQELHRRNSTISYYNTNDCEVDFVLQEEREVTALIQVAFSLHDPEIRKREIKALLKASSTLRCSNLLLITWEEEGVEKINGCEIKIVPIWRWLLA